MAELLYPDFAETIELDRKKNTLGADQNLLEYGTKIGEKWFEDRCTDGWQEPQEDKLYDKYPGKHRPDPFNPNQMTLGRKWGLVRPFVIGNIEADAPLDPPPNLTEQGYADAYDQVFDFGSSELTQRGSDAQHMAAIGIFWGYDGSNKLGTPPRLYNQVVRKIPTAAPDVLAHNKRIRLFTAINVAMADAGIAAWHYKYKYNLWRPVVAIREAEADWGSTGIGDGNTLRNRNGNPFWKPLGAPRSNPFPNPVSGASGENFTPNFPAYPSGHATFGTACFETAAELLSATPDTLTVKFASDELNGSTTDYAGVTRPRWERDFTLREAINENKLSRIFLGVHWIFDATGGETVGKAIADKVVAAFI